MQVVEICGFAIYGINSTHLRICDLHIRTPKKFADLPIAECAQGIAELLFADLEQKFACPTLVTVRQEYQCVVHRPTKCRRNHDCYIQR